MTQPARWSPQARRELTKALQDMEHTRFGYVLVYDPTTDPVEILRFVHTRRDLPRVLAHLLDAPEEPGG